MIRHRHGNDFLLFAQHDHALLAGRLAEHLGGSQGRRPTDATLAAIRLHDSGWPLHDDLPTIDSQGRPLHVFQTPPDIAVRVWAASAQIAAQQDPYAGLLVSLHVLNLAGMAAALPAHQGPHDAFALNKFQHAQIELQEQLRTRLGLAIDRPLTHGLAPPGLDAREDALQSDLLLLRAMDLLSLALLCDVEMAQCATPAPFMGASDLQLNVQRVREFEVSLHPWPFDVQELAMDIPARRIAAGPFESDEAFRAAYARSPVQAVSVQIHPAAA